MGLEIESNCWHILGRGDVEAGRKLGHLGHVERLGQLPSRFPQGVSSAHRPVTSPGVLGPNSGPTHDVLGYGPALSARRPSPPDEPPGGPAGRPSTFLAFPS